MAVVASVAINIDSRGAAQKLREVADRSKQVDRAVKGSSQSLAGQSRQLQSVATSASRTTAAFNGLAGALGKVAAAFSVIQGARFVFAKTAELETQTRSLTVLTGSAQRATQIIRELQQLGAVTPFTSTELIDAAKRLQAFGVEGDKVVETTRRLADVSGATGAELEGLVTAYGQVQAKGRLQGEELLQFQERGVALQQVLREQYGLTGEEFQKALEKGQISAQAVEVALLKLTDAGGKYANGAIAQSDTLAGRLSTLQDSIQNLAARLGTILAPAMQSILGLAIDIANQINSVFETILLQRQLGANLPAAQRDRLFKQAGQEAEQIARLRGGGTIDPAVFTDLQEQRFRDLMRTYGYQQGILTPPKPAAPTATPTLPKLGTGTGAGATRTGGRSGADKAAAEEARIQARIRGLQIETQATQQLAVLRGRIAEAEIAGNEELAIRLRGVEREQQILVQYQQSIGDITDERVRQAMEAKALADLEMAGIETAIDLEKQRLKLLKEQNDEFFKRAGLTPQDKMPSGAGAFDPSLPDLRVSPAEQQMATYRAELDALTNPINMAVTGANAIGDAFGQAFQDIATGAKSTEQALADTFKAIGEAFISMAVQIIAKQIAMITFQTLLKALGGGGSFGFSGAGPYQMPSGGGFAQGFSLPKLNATGSMVTGPTNAIIGEAGPEAVMPLQRGTDGKMGVQIADNRAFLDSLTTGFAAAIDEASDDPAAAATDNRASLREVERLQENRTQIMTQQMEAERRYERERIEQMASTPGNLNIKYESQVINNVEYVTRDQAERMAAQSALRGRELAIGALQNSVKTRKRVGI